MNEVKHKSYQSIFYSLEINDPVKAFEKAIKEGRLSKHTWRRNYAGHYMYMNTQDGKDLFKHRDTRMYIK